MTYKIIIQDSAIADAGEYAAFLLDQSKSRAVAARWLDELDAVVSGLAEMPRRYRIIEEQESFSIELRQIPYYSHRIVYHVNDDAQRVHVLRICHGARKPLSPGDASLLAFS